MPRHRALCGRGENCLRDLLPPLKGWASSFTEEAYAKMGIAPQYPQCGFPLQRLQFGPVQPYGPGKDQCNPFLRMTSAAFMSLPHPFHDTTNDDGGGATSALTLQHYQPILKLRQEGGNPLALAIASRLTKRSLLPGGRVKQKCAV